MEPFIANVHLILPAFYQITKLILGQENTGIVPFDYNQPKIHTTTRLAKRAPCNRKASPYIRSLSSRPLVADVAEVDAAVDFVVWVNIPVVAVVEAAFPVDDEAAATTVPVDVWAAGDAEPEAWPVSALPPQVALILAKGGIPAEVHPQSVTQAEYTAMNEGSQ